MNFNQLNRNSCIAVFAILLSVVVVLADSTKVASSPFSDFISDVMDLSDAASASSGLPRVASRPRAPSPPDLAAAAKRSAISVTADSSFSDIPEHMKDFHRRVLEHIRASSERRPSNEFLQNSPEYMVNLYNQKLPEQDLGHSSSEMNGKQETALKRSDVVRSFEAIESYKESDKLVMVFDTSAILSQERIRLAELQIQMPGDYRDVTSIEIWDERRATSGGKTILERVRIGSVSFDAKRMPTNHKITTDVTRAIRRWYNANQRNKHEDSKVSRDEDSSQFIELVRSRRSLAGQESTERQMLFVYSTNKDIDLVDVAVARQDRNRRSSKRSQVKKRSGQRSRGGKRRNRQSKKRNKTDRHSVEIDETRHNDFEVDSTSQQGSIAMSNDFEFGEADFQKVAAKDDGKDEIEEWRKSQSDVIIVTKQKSQQEDAVVTPQLSSATPSGHSFAHQERKSSHCRKVDFEIDFEKIGWGDWIVFPKRYNAYRCEGECRYPLRNAGKQTNHAYMQSLLSSISPDAGIPQPCCVPTKLKPLSILYYEDGIMKQREHEDMVVAECGCQ